MEVGIVIHVPSNWTQVVLPGKQIHICSGRSGSFDGSISPSLLSMVELFGFGILGLGSVRDLISHGSWIKKCGRAEFVCGGLQQQIQKSFAKLQPSWCPRGGAPDPTSSLQKSGGRLQTRSSFFSWCYFALVHMLKVFVKCFEKERDVQLPEMLLLYSY